MKKSRITGSYEIDRPKNSFSLHSTVSIKCWGRIKKDIIMRKPFPKLVKTFAGSYLGHERPALPHPVRDAERGGRLLVLRGLHGQGGLQIPQHIKLPIYI